MSASRLDAVYRSLLITKFFTKGWGKPENLRRLFEFRKIVSNREECFKLIDRDYPVTITKEETAGDCKIVEGHFMSPLEKFLPGIVPEIAQKAHFQALVPLKWADPDFRPMCLHLAGTGDHYFWRRRNLMAKPLLKEAGIGGIILENPFYGLRKPLDQVRSSLHNVSDIFVMGGCLILESLVLFHWCERNNLGPLGVTGLSMGGHMASLAATNWPKPLVLVPCLSWSTASAVFLQGVMSQSINWDLLEDQYLSDGNYREKLSKMVTVIDEAFLAGKNFAQKVSQSMGDTLQSKLDNKNHMEAETITHSKMDDNSTDGIVKNIKTDDEISKNEIVNANSKNENLKTELVNESCVDEMAKTTKMDFVNTKNFVSINKSVSATRKQSEDVARFIIELKGLLHEGLISESLYLKLTSDEKFELDAQDVEELNELNKDEILARAAGKFNLGQKINIKCYSTNSSYTESDKQHGRVVNKTAQHTQVTTTKAGVIRTTINHSNSQLETDTKIAKVIVTEKKTRNFGEMSTDILTSLPFIKRKVRTKKIDISKINWRDREALQFMRGVMDECTHLSNFSVPFDTSLIIAVCAKHDAYVPREDVGELEEIWPGAEVRYVDAGHVSAYLLHQSMFRSCIIEAFERSKKKWKDGKHIA